MRVWLETLLVLGQGKNAHYNLAVVVATGLFMHYRRVHFIRIYCKQTRRYKLSTYQIAKRLIYGIMTLVDSF